ncbi:hypothetical protein OG989_04210 [Micromonospora sp. NBC_01740]|uniref:hypothetical protein n=1 Tax=Micromonospora sp. NBC_01740 TaxID=2975986 RepID=UPI002E142316|nr:hypothetical protein OG989_04210 [Micromonospora sp. NBC_01740]
MPAATNARADGTRRWTCTAHPRHVAGCTECQQRSAARCRIRNRQIAYGTWRGMTDATAATEHVAKLVAEGWSARRIAEAADVARAVVHRLVNRTAVELFPETNDAILALPVVPCDPAGGVYVDSTGTARRLQALTAIGYDANKLAAELGIAGQPVRRWRRQTRPKIAARYHKMIAGLYERLALTPGTSAEARRLAARKGWAGPLAWDDIDDPNEQPHLDGPKTDTDDFDPVTVGQAVDGDLTYEQLAAHRPDVVETVRRLAPSHSDTDIAHFLRWPGRYDLRADGISRAARTIEKLRRDHGIPGRRQAPSIAPRIRRRTAQAA